MANERYEGVGLDGHYTLAERIFTKIKGLFDTKVKTDVPANAVFTDTLPTAYCDSAADATTKVAQCTNFSLKNNSYIPINFINGNTVEAFTEVTLNINNTGAKPLYVNWVFEGGQRTSQPFDASTYIIYYTNNAYYLYTNGTLFPYKNTPNISDIRYYTVGSEDNSVEVVEEQGPGLLGHPENWSIDLSVPLATTVSNGLLSAADKIKIDDFEDTKVTQTNTTGDADYRVLFSYDANDTSQTNTARKNTNLKYNPYSQTLTVGTKEDPYARGVITLRGGTNSPAYLDVDGVISVLDSDMGCLFVKSDDIELFSSVDPSYTWDGVNTSLKDALNAIEDTKVTQTELSADEVREILIAGTSTTATITTGAAKSVGLRIHPNAKAIMEGDNTLATTFSSHAEGAGSTASGMYSHAEGYYTRANGQGTHVEGYQNFSTTATAYGGHAEGFCTTINSGPGAHAEGFHTYADGLGSHAEGYYTTAKGNFPHAEGNYVYASGDGSHAEGYKTTAKAYQSHAEGNYTYANNNFTHVEGNYSTGNGYYSHSEGDHSISSGVASHTEGCYTNATTTGAHAEGYGTSAKHNTADGVGSHAEGFGTCASGLYAHSEGENTKAIGQNSHAEGYQTCASGLGSHTEGGYTTASNYYAHAEGSGSYASGNYAHAEGYKTTASGECAHAEGNNTYARSNYTHAEGYRTTADSAYGHAEGLYTFVGGYSGAHAEGYRTTANGNSSHAEGYSNLAAGESAHAENNNTCADGYYSHAEGNYTTATHRSQHVFGEYNDLDASTATGLNKGTYVEIVGNGLSSTQLSNARTLDWNGNEKIAGNLTDKWGLQTSRSLFQSEFDNLTQSERDNGTTYYIKDGEPLRICDYIYPVGAIYMSVNNISPAILFGGTWERIKDTFLLAAGDNYTAGGTGGEAEHILITDEIPAHTHGNKSLTGTMNPLAWAGSASESGIVSGRQNHIDRVGNSGSNWGDRIYTINASHEHNSVGLGYAHNNMPPYLTVYMWKRVPDPVQQEENNEEQGE